MKKYIYLQSFMLIPVMVFEFYLWQSLKCKNEQLITPSICKAELWFLYTAHLPYKIYQLTKFHVEFLYNYRVMSRTRFIKRGDNSIQGLTGYIVSLHCTFSQWDLSTYKVSCWSLIIFLDISRTKYKVQK
jgi:hypothetical protein